MNFARILRNGIQLGFTEKEIAAMYLSKYIMLLRDIRAERREIDERRRAEEEQREIQKLAKFSHME